MTACSRGCVHYRRHLPAKCPVKDHESTAWVSATFEPEELRDRLMDADYRATHPEAQAVARLIYIGRYGGLEAMHTCRGCKPRPATNGAVCEQCHLRLTDWLSGEFSIAWAYDWLASDMEPRQNAAGLGDIIRTSKVPPAALALHIHDLRQEIAQAYGSWLGMVCQQFGLHGPEWWRHRIDEAERRSQPPPRPAGISSIDWSAQHPRLNDWRAWLPQNQAEITEAQRYLFGWLDRIENVPDLTASIYDTAHDLMIRVAGLAPWRAEPRKLPGIACPSCERDALALFEGSENVTCRRCGEVITRAKYDRWAALLESEKVSAASERMAS